MIKVELGRLLFDRGMTVATLARQAGVSRENLSRLKTGDPRSIRFTTLAAVCDVLDCEPGDLLRRATPKPAEPPAAPASPSLPLESHQQAVLDCLTQEHT